jgi:hypothetical protein
MDARTRGGQPLLRETPLPPDGTMPFQVQVDTTGKSGKVDLTLQFECKQDGEHFMATAKAELNVRPGLRITPQHLFFGDVNAGDTVSGEFFVLDALPDPGCEIVECYSSAPNCLTVDLVPFRGEERTFGSGADIKTRYRGSVSFTPSREGCLYNEWVTIVPKGPFYRVAEQIAVVCRTRPPAYKLVPGSLVIPVGVGQFHRALRCVLGSEATTEIKVLRKPQWVSVSFKDIDDKTIAIDINASVPPSVKPGMVEEVEFCGSTEDTPVLKLPIRFIASD